MLYSEHAVHACVMKSLDVAISARSTVKILRIKISKTLLNLQVVVLPLNQTKKKISRRGALKMGAYLKGYINHLNFMNDWISVATVFTPMPIFVYFLMNPPPVPNL